MGRFQSCKVVVERSLRRAFYDGVLELYEGHGSSDTVTAVSLEGTLTLTINRAETLHIRLNEVAQRAEEVSLEQEDSAHTAHHQENSEALDREQGSCGRKRKHEIMDEKDDDKKEAMKKKLKTENDTTTSHEHPVVKSSDAETDLGSSQTKPIDRKELEKSSKAVKPKSENYSGIHIKKEPEEATADCEPDTSPGPSSAPSNSCSSRTPEEETAASVSGKRKSEDHLGLAQGSDTSFPVQVKKEPKVESILIEDEDEEDDECEDLSSQRYNRVQQASPIHSLWYKRPQGSRHHGSSHRATAREREHSVRKSYPSPHTMEMTDPRQMAVLLERNDCPVCGEVLHTRKELGSHLHAHRHALRATCSVCRTNTLTLDALLLHLSTVHSPRLLPVTPAMTSDSLLSQALMPALPYTPTPMSAIASLVSMAACQAGGPSSAAFLAGGSGMAGGVSSLMEQIITYRGLLPCPVCQLLCSSKQHLATHLALMHRDTASIMGQGGGEEEEAEEDVVKAEGRQDSDGEGSSNFSCFDCSQSFSSQVAFTQHCMLQHNSTSAVSQGSCSVCHRAFHTWRALHAHYLSAHAITNFCDRCKMGFVSSAELKTHYDSTHSADTRNLTYICDICNKGFYSQSQCSAHKRSHISEKSFACQVCGSAFFKRGDLSKHFRTVHAPNRVFGCRFCGKRGTRMDNMRSHVKSHGKHMTRDEVLSFIEEVSPN
ncbi:uncharacterized protein LOC143293472 [Babylonia areolata]|uniref:uncharacterized protein LOC143293472 n=1 Tax=Babylonia areolata TaxID=304850 RepID=UPI003FD1D371